MRAVESDEQAQREMIAATLAGPEFEALDPSEQAFLKDKYLSAAETPAAPAQEARTAAAPAGREKREPRERDRNREKTWRFENYELHKDPAKGAFLIFENRSKYDQSSGQYRRNNNPQRTAIRLTPELAERLPSEPELGRDIIEFCEQLRRQLDDKGALAVHFNLSKKNGEDRTPVWTVTYDGGRQKPIPIEIGERSREQGPPKQVDPRELPPYLNRLAQEYWRLYDPIWEEEREKNPDMSARDLNALVRSRIPEEKWYFSKRYNRKWSDWEGRARQHIREEIISAELAKRRFAVKTTVEPRPAEAASAQEPAERPPAEETPRPTAPAAEQPAETRERPSPSEPATVAEQPAEPARETAAETRDAGRRDQEMLDFSRPIYAPLLPKFAETFDGGRTKEDRLAVIKLVTKSTLEVLRILYERNGDREAMSHIWNESFWKKLSWDITKEYGRQETSKKFFESHSFYDEQAVEVVTDNHIAFALDKFGSANENEALNQTARQLVFDSLYGESSERDERPVGDEDRLIAIVEETLRRLKDRRGNIAEYNGRSGRVAVTDLNALRNKIRSMVRPGQ